MNKIKKNLKKSSFFSEWLGLYPLPLLVAGLPLAHAIRKTENYVKINAGIDLEKCFPNYQLHSAFPELSTMKKAKYRVSENFLHIFFM